MILVRLFLFIPFMEKGTKKNSEVSDKKSEETTPATAAESAKRGPLKYFREGDVSVSIWPHEHQGRVYYSCTFQRSYESKGERRYTHSFSRDDLGQVVSVCKQASDYLKSLEDASAQ